MTFWLLVIAAVWITASVLAAPPIGRRLRDRRPLDPRDF